MRVFMFFYVFMCFGTSLAMPSLDLLHTLDTGLALTDRNASHLGRIVSFIGDVNNDGYDDIMIGAPNLAASMVTSYVYIYYGGADMDTTADVILEKKGGSVFGIAVSAAGDLNGDDYDDVMVGDGEAVYIYYGGSDMDTTHDIVLEGKASGSGFGNSLSLAGDVNHDGYTDLLVGAPDHSAAGFQMGRAFIYSGYLQSNSIASDLIATEHVALYQNYPNPFNLSTMIRYELKTPGIVSLNIYNVTGQKIKELMNAYQTAGIYSAYWNAENLASGLYFYRLQVGECLKTKKLLLQK